MYDHLTTLTGFPVPKIAEKLAEPLDPRAYKGVPGGADLTDINTGYMIERATQVFGLRGLGWKLEYSPEAMQFIGLGEGKRVTAHLKYAMFSFALVDERGEALWFPIVTSGASTNEFAYAEEGARTAAIGAALKSLCFQLPVYKGLLDHHNAAKMLAEASNAGTQGSGNGSQPSGNGKTPHAAGGKPAQPASQAPPTTAEPDDDPAQFAIVVGKAAGKKLGEVPRKIVEWYARDLKPTTPEAQALQTAARAFLERYPQAG
jgi:hypothetical protein